MYGERCEIGKINDLFHNFVQKTKQKQKQKNAEIFNISIMGNYLLHKKAKCSRIKVMP